MAQPTHVAFPHMLRARFADRSEGGLPLIEVDLVSIDDVHPGDIVPLHFSMAKVKEVMETRKARGDWSGKKWEGVEPKWWKCLCVQMPRRE